MKDQKEKLRKHLVDHHIKKNKILRNKPMQGGEKLILQKL